MSGLAFVVLTLAAYQAGRWLRDRTGGHALAQPVLVAVVVVGAVVLAFDVEYVDYQRGAEVISFWLGPATVALAVPLHRQVHRLSGYLGPLLAAVVLGALVSTATAIGLVTLLGGEEQLARTMAPKATTAPVAIALSESLGGVPPLTAAIGIVAGILGAVAGPAVLTWARVRDQRARGLAIGAASHGIGTSRALVESPVEGAFSGLSMGLTALVTSVLLPAVAWLLLRS